MIVQATAAAVNWMTHDRWFVLTSHCLGPISRAETPSVLWRAPWGSSSSPISVLKKKKRGRKRCIVTAIDRQWVLLFQGSVDRSSEKWCSWNNNRFSDVLQKHSDWCSWRWQLFGFALKIKFGYVSVSLQKWQWSQRLVFTLSQVSGTLVLVFISLAWGRYDEKLY